MKIKEYVQKLQELKEELRNIESSSVNYPFISKQLKWLENTIVGLEPLKDSDTPCEEVFQFKDFMDIIVSSQFYLDNRDEDITLIKEQLVNDNDPIRNAILIKHYMDLSA